MCLVSITQSGEKTSPQELFHLCEAFCKDHLSNIGGMVPGESHMDGSDIIGIVVCVGNNYNNTYRNC